MRNSSHGSPWSRLSRWSKVSTRLRYECGRMLSPKTQTNLKNAQSYFDEHLAVGDYYGEGEQVVGEWIGRGAVALGLSAAVGKNEFLKLCENRHPKTGERLIVRMKDTRQTQDGGEVANRRVFFDFTFSPPKSVSIAALVGEDQRIVARASRSGSDCRAGVGDICRHSCARWWNKL